MDYKEEYQKALERAKKGLPIDEVFPELKESEDERIRKWLIAVIEEVKTDDDWCADLNKCDEAIAWLKKQKDLEKILKPKFNRGDKITNGENIYTIGKIEHDGYVLDEDCCIFIPFDCQEKWERVQEFKSINWSEQDEKIIGRLRSIVNKCALFDGALDVNGDYCEGDYGELDKWLKRLTERFNIQPKQKWSKEDEKIFNSLCTVLHGGLSSIPTEKFISWLKSRLSQPQKEWSEEDEKMLQHIVSDLREFRDCETDEELISDYEDEISWLKNRLKSLRPQPRWKPSEEQVEALKNSAYGTYQNGDGPALRELYEQLEKMI